MTAKTWNYRGRRLRLLEWGLWRSDRDGEYFLCYRPRGRNGPVVRRWVTVGGDLTVTKLKTHVRGIRAEIEAKKIQAPVSLPVAEALADYIGELERRGRSPRHISDVDAALKRFVAETGIDNLRAVGVLVIERFLSGLEVAARTQNKYRSHLHAWFAWARRRDIMDENPAEAVERTTETRRLVRFPMPAEMMKMAERVAPRQARLLTFVAFTGLRRKSVLSLDEGCFTPDGIRVPHSKDGGEFWISFSAGCPLWGGEITRLGLAIWREAPPTQWELRLARQAAWGYTLHALRHAFCSWLAMMGEDMKDIAAWAGHSTAATTEKWYAHLRPGGRARLAVEFVDPAYTSQTCHRCGSKGVRNQDRFSCTTCGVFDADINAALNIAGGGVVNRPKSTGAFESKAPLLAVG